MGVNKEQEEAISHGQGPCMVLAPPGSGKTMVVTYRTRHLIEQLKISADQILVITFTRYAAREMKERFEMLTCGKEYPVTFGTFHSVFYHILKCEYGIKSSNLMIEKETVRLVKSILGSMYIESDIETDDDEELLENLVQEIGIVKNNLYRLDEFKSRHLNQTEFAELFRTYEEEKRKRHLFDFDDMLVQCYALFRRFPDKLERWKKRFTYILVDEFQDINKVQYEILRMLSGENGNLFVVGDDDQSIYGFRGAHPEFMLKFKEDYPNMRMVSLKTNYRSTEFILNAAARMIFHNQHRYKKSIRSYRGTGNTVHIQETKNETEESRYIVSRIEKDLQDGIPAGEICVLFRAGIQARMLTETLQEHHIPFQMKEFMVNIYQHFIAKDMIAYMKLGMGERHRSLFLTICNRPVRYLSRTCMDQEKVDFEDLRKCYAEKEWMQDIIDQFDIDIRMLNRMAPFAAVQYIRKRIGYDEFLKQYAKEHQIPLEQLMEVMCEFENRCREYRTYEEFLQHVVLYTEELENQNKENQKIKERNKEKIQLMTMHASKGLEFQSVYIIHANEGEIPYQKAQTEEEIEEERRTFYVAMTRAKDRLEISYLLEKHERPMKSSRFVNEILGQASS